jgi:hypothetical protein
VESRPRIETLQLRLRVPQHVVFRDFVSETVLLNIETGQYHGLNPTAGRMLTVLDGAGSVEAAAKQLAKEFDQPIERVADDLSELCEGLLERKLLEIHEP